MSFITPIFLIGAAAAALPVIFHFVRKMRAKKVPFGSLMFLQATPKEVVKRRRLRDVLLMSLRAAMLALLAFAFARPFLPQEQIPFIPQRENRSVVFLLDQSFSMQVADRFEQAKQEVRDRLDAAGGNDEFAVILFSDVARQATDFGQDRALHRTVLENAEAGYRPTDYYEPLRLAEEVLQDARYEDRTVVLVSDFQRTGWTGALDNWTLSDGVEFVPVSVGEAVPGNAYVEAFNLSTKRAGQEVAVQYDARVAAQGDRIEPGNAAALVVDGSEVDRQTVPAQASSRVSFQQIAPREGVFQGQIALADDALPLDNRYYFTYPVAARPSVLVVSEADRRARSTEAFFLGKAFDLGDAGLYDFRSGGRAGLSRGALQGEGVVFLANVGALSAAQLGAVQEYVEEGGSVVVSFGEQTNIDAFSRHLQALGVGSIEQRVSARAEQGAEAIIGEVDLRHPVFEIFGGAGRGAILRPQFRQYVRVVPDSAAAVLGRFDSGDPFLVERRLGQGKVLVYTSSFSTGWTDFPINESFVPFVYQLAKYGLSGADVRRQYTVGEPVALTGRPGEEWEVRTPEGEVYKVTLDDPGTGFFRETEVPGHYLASSGRAPFAFSVNVDPRESDLAPRDAEEVYAAVVPPSDDVATSPEQAAALEVEDEEQKQKLWRVVLLLILALFAAETVLAHRRPGSRKRRR